MGNRQMTTQERSIFNQADKCDRLESQLKREMAKLEQMRREYREGK